MTATKSGEIKLYFHPVRPENIVDYALAPFAKQIEERQISLSREVDADLPSVTADLEKIAWVLINFMSNAIRYTPRWGTIKIEVRRENDDIRFSVENSGDGIDAKQLEKIFES